MGKWSEKFSEDTQGTAPTELTKGSLGGFVSAQPYDCTKNHAFSSETKSRLRNAVYNLTDDCVKWYAEDGEILEQMSENDLERMVLDYLSKRDWYNRNGTNDNEEKRNER